MSVMDEDEKFSLEDMEFSNSCKFYMVKSPPPIKEAERKKRERELFTYPRITFSKYAQSVFNGDKPGTEKVDYLFYPGCGLSAVNPEYVEEAYKYLLSRIKEGVGIMLGCCGTPAEKAGRKELVQQSADRFKEVWNETGKPAFILACSSCSNFFERFLPEITTISLQEIFQKYGLPESDRLCEVHDLEGIALQKMPELSQRQANKANLKNKLLRELWSEDTDMNSMEKDRYHLIISPEVKEDMEKRFILPEDAEKVVAHSRTTGQRFYNPEDSSYLANLRMDSVTYWVQYEEKEDGIHILSVYSHRMEIVKE